MGTSSSSFGSCPALLESLAWPHVGSHDLHRGFFEPQPHHPVLLSLNYLSHWTSSSLEAKVCMVDPTGMLRLYVLHEGMNEQCAILRLGYFLSTQNLQPKIQIMFTSQHSAYIVKKQSSLKHCFKNPLFLHNDLELQGVPYSPVGWHPHILPLRYRNHLCVPSLSFQRHSSAVLRTELGARRPGSQPQLYA